MLTTSELSRLRAAHTSTLTATCTIWRKTQATTSAGGANDTWAQIGGNIPCRLMPEHSRRLIAEMAGREIMTSYYRLTVPHDTDLQADDKVIFGGDTYQLVMLWDDHDLRTARRAIMAKVS